PVELLPVSLQEYETTFSRLDRHEVLSVWREVESEREAQLEIAKRLRKQLAGEINAPRPCLSPIVEGRDSAVGTSSTLLLLNPDIRVTDSSPISSQDDSAIADCGKRLHSSHQPPAYRSVSVPLLVVTRSDNSILEREEEDLDEHGSMHLDVPFPWDTFSDTSQESELMLLQDTPSPMCHDYGGRTGLKCLIGEESEWDRVGRCYSEESETAQEFWEVSKGGKADHFDEHDEDLELEEAVSADGIHDHTELSSDQNMLTTGHSMLSSSQHASHALQHTLTRVHQSMRKHDCRKQLRVQIIDRNGSGSKKCVTTSAKKKAARKTRLTAESITNIYQRGPSLEKEDENETPIKDEETINEEEYLIKHQGGQLHMGRSGGDFDLPSKKLILHKVFSRSEIDVSKMKISQQESRIIEILAFKRYQEEYEERRKEKERRKWEKDRKGREMTKKETEREFRKQLLQKRRKENEECQRRLILAREQFLESQEYLRQLLKDKDERKKNLIETINRQKRTLIRQWREREETRKSSVDTAVQQLLQRDTQYRYSSTEGYKVQTVQYGGEDSTKGFPVQVQQDRGINGTDTAVPGIHSTGTAVQKDT
ncbi:trichohyalin, partial [Eurytemora carolleeae]|uniref:trichohyalin n=1 Tax=Eurytemora carolleeae TaxID=1294199 RepID=UPI000C7705B1